MKRKIVEIKRELCNGCGLCVTACHEGAIQMIDGKAELISDIYCDGLGDCLPACPTDAIKIIEREADEYDQEAVDAKIAKEGLPSPGGAKKPDHPPVFSGCPGTMARMMDKKPAEKAKPEVTAPVGGDQPSELRQWPVQLSLINPAAPYLKGADLLVAADCCAFAHGNFHRDFIKDKITMIGCPKLDDNQFYQQKLTQIFAQNSPASITVVRMEVPCCGGIVAATKQAMLDSGTIVPYNEVTISTEGEVV